MRGGDCRYLYCPAEGGGGDIKHEVVDHIGTVADELGVLDFFNDHEQVAGHAAAFGIVALAAESEGLAFDSAGRDRECNFLLATLHALAVAVRARLGDNLACAVATLADSL